MNTALIVFVKNPVPGRVKTRLAQVVGADRALDIYLRLQAHTRNITLAAPFHTHYVYYSDHIAAQDDWSHGFQKAVQQGADLGMRMYNALAAVLGKHDRAIIIGSDCGELTTDILRQAITALDTQDAVIGPARDGGYYLLGIKKADTSLFSDIVWSTDQVGATTQARIAALGWSCHTLPVLSDVDYVEDWERLGWDA